MKKIVLILILLLPVCVHAQFTTVTNATTNYRSTFTGNLGINMPTTSTVPSDKLHVIGITRADQFNAVNGYFNVPNTTNDLHLRTNGTTRLLINRTNGFVRIGSTTAADYTLDVSGTINATTIRRQGVEMVSSQWTTASSNINFTTGIVSIGTTTAPTGYKLAVAGKTLTEEVVVKLQANWPDYVFSNSYNLMPLSELESYINQNKHLPEVPSAKEVAENGIAVGEMSATLLKKIEELTLYVIELKKENEKQQALINALAEQVKK
jgi:hypothetical protein